MICLSVELGRGWINGSLGNIDKRGINNFGNPYR